MRKIIVAIFLFMMGGAWAVPKEIIVVRHADKNLQNPGHFLNAKGYLRAISFSSYYLKKYPAPDFIFITNAYRNGRLEHSTRELQTIAPLSNQLEMHGKKLKILFPYAPAEYAKLAHLLLTDSVYSGKTILICWDHRKIPRLLDKLGAKLNLTRWPAHDFDSVAIIHYEHVGVQSQLLHHQYPVSAAVNWHQL